MGRHARRKHRLGWIVPVGAGIAAAVIGIAAYATGAPGARVSSPDPLPVFTTEPAFPSSPAPVQPSPKPSVVTYIVRPGDTLTSIARIHCGHPDDWTVLQKANHIADPDAISAGETLKITCQEEMK